MKCFSLLLSLICLLPLSLFSASEPEQRKHHISLQERIITYSKDEKNQFFLKACQKKTSAKLQRKLNTNHSPRTIILSLLKGGTDINVQDENGRTALHLACVENNFILIKTLIENKANPDIQDKNGQTPLHIACQLQLTTIVEALIYADARRDIQDNKEKYPRDLVSDDWELIALMSAPHTPKRK